MLQKMGREPGGEFPPVLEPSHRRSTSLPVEEGQYFMPAAENDLRFSAAAGGTAAGETEEEESADMQVGRMLFRALAKRLAQAEGKISQTQDWVNEQETQLQLTKASLEREVRSLKDQVAETERQLEASEEETRILRGAPNGSPWPAASSKEHPLKKFQHHPSASTTASASEWEIGSEAATDLPQEVPEEVQRAVLAAAGATRRIQICSCFQATV